ncbi:P-type E1-E2 ATPase [Haloactinopolyspora alba]|uniref:P-type E1-E2 ATPase n=1 Tax=Haloactinopolyspora alba TaxID=648780 RepID=A0A2P8E139_9ACTN|nr:HAD-IC family P-type ATPase [Haloactinopolyspora alba]PSL03201.1 P-type E1-E2 ATPase [Haloactinopolyspora alba]
MRAEDEGDTVVFVGWDGATRGVLVVADIVDETAARAVAELRDLGLNPVLLTGDDESPPWSVAEQVGIDEIVPEMLPAGQLEPVAHLHERGAVVSMVGDGVNDTAALAGSDLGLSIGTCPDVVPEEQDVTLVRGDLRTAAEAVRLFRRILSIVKANEFWAFAVHFAALPLAATGMLSPLAAVAVTAMSAVVVVVNSLRLRWFRASAPLTFRCSSRARPRPPTSPVGQRPKIGA